MEPFRDATAQVRAQAEALRRVRLAELGPIRVWRSVYVWRWARLGFGVAGCAGALAVAAALAPDVPGHPTFFDLIDEVGGAHAGAHAMHLLWAWAVALVSAAVAAVSAAVVLRRRLHASVAPSDDPFRDLAGLAAHGPRSIERALARRHAHAHASWVAPLAAAVLLIPFTFQLAVAVHAGTALARFDHWMIETGPWVLHVMAYGLYAAWHFPHRLRITRIVLVGTALGLVPLGPASAGLVFVCGSVVAVVAFWPMRAIIRRERALGLDPDPRAGLDDADLHRGDRAATFPLDAAQPAAPQ